MFLSLDSKNHRNKKKSNEQTKQVFAVSGEKSRFRRHSIFIETSNLEFNTRNESAEISTSSNVQSVAGQNDTAAINLIGSSDAQTNESAVKHKIVGNNLIEFPLLAEKSDDLILIESSLRANSGNVTEPILFRNGYFKIINQENDNVSAMCCICGLDENNQPKMICKSKKNVTSNFISHLKVKYKKYNLLVLSILFSFSYNAKLNSIFSGNMNLSMKDIAHK